MLKSDELKALKDARLRLKSGWCKNAVAKDKHGFNIGRENVKQASSVCLAGGLYAAGVPYQVSYAPGYSDTEERISDELMVSIRELYPEKNSYSVRGFNDNPFTTLEEVLHVIEHTISRNSQ